MFLLYWTPPLWLGVCSIYSTSLSVTTHFPEPPNIRSRPLVLALLLVIPWCMCKSLPYLPLPYFFQGYISKSFRFLTYIL
ncbi:hypothetical protein FKM82_021075 [Ascaphus truei]